MVINARPRTRRTRILPHVPRTTSALLFLLALLAAPHLTIAQGDRTFSLKKYGTTDGLLHRAVTSITQDADGFLWLATPVGIQRFDGHHFTAWTKAEGLTGDRPTTLVKDSQGLIWVLYSISEKQRVSGIDILDPRTGLAVPFERFFGPRAGISPRELLLHNRVLADSTLLFGGEGEVVSYHHRRGFTRHRLELPGEHRPLHRTADGRLLSVRTTSEGRTLLPHYYDAQGRPQGVAPTHELDYLTTLGLSGEAEPAHAERAFGCGVHLITRTAQGVREHWLSPTGELRVFNAEPIDELMHARHRMNLGDDLWLVGSTLRMLKDGEPSLQAPIVYDMASVAPEMGFRINHAVIDRLGHVWIGTDFGLFRLTIQPTHFQRFLWQDTAPMGMGIRIRGMGVQGDKLHVNTEVDGYWVLDAHTGRVLAHDTLLGNRSGLYVSEGGEVWRSRGYDVVHDHARGSRTLCTLPALVRSFLPLGPDTLLIGTNEGLFLWTAQTGAKAVLSVRYGSLQRSTVMHLAHSRGALWACTNAGLFRLDASGRPVEQWGNTSADAAHRLPTQDVRHVHHDEQGNLWLATGDAGIVMRTPDGTVRTVGRAQGLPSLAVHAIHSDASGHLWASTDDGLVRYHPATGQLRVFTAAQGLAHDEFNRHAHAIGPDGRMYFGGLNGITAFHPADLAGEAPTPGFPPLVITRASQFLGDTRNVADRTAAVRRGEPITVRHGDTYFNLGFALLGFEDPHNVLYAWRLEGIDADWNLQREPDLRFTALPYGRHMLHIKAQGSNGIWSPQELHIPIVVQRPWWLQWWAITGALLLISAVVYLVVRYRLRAAARVYAMRDRIAADLHDEVGSSLSNIAMFGELLRDHGTEQPPRVQRMIERITSNSARALENMNDIVWNVNSRSDRPEHLVARMRAYAAEAAEAKGFELRFTTTGPLARAHLDMEQRKNIHLVMKEAVNNAAKYSGCTLLEITLQASPGVLRLTVADNGIGFTPGTGSRTGGGNGLPNMHARAQRSGATLQVNSAPDHGTTVVLDLPLRTASSILGTRRSTKTGPFVP